MGWWEASQPSAGQAWRARAGGPPDSDYFFNDTIDLLVPRLYGDDTAHDLGWAADDRRAQYELTLPDDQLGRSVRALLDTADACLREWGMDLSGESWLKRETEPKKRADGWSEAQIRAARWESVEPWLDEDLNLAAACLAALERVE